MSLAIASFQSNPRQSIRALAAAYDVPGTTLRTRLHGTKSRSEIRSDKRKLLPVEEQSLVQWILSLDRRGFPPQIIDVRRMTNVLLARRGQDPPPLPVGKNWTTRFINSQSELQTKWNRKFHSQRARCEDPVTIAAWFRLVAETREAYGIVDEDAYNFDETGFMMGVAATSKVVTSSDTVENIFGGFRATGLIPYCPDYVLSSLTVVRTPSPPATTAATNVAWVAETPRTVAQVEQQARHLRDLLRRQSQIPTSQAIRQLVKGCQLAMNAATMLTEENKRLHALNHRQQRKANQRRQYIARRGALRVRQAQELAVEADRVVVDADQGQPTERRPRAPPTCTICHIQGHNRTQCAQR